MNSLKLPFALIATLIIGTSNLFGSTSVKDVLDTATVKQQLDYVLKKSTTYEDYKVIKITWVNKLRSNVLDSLHASKQALILTQKDVKSRQQKIDSLSSSLEQTESKLNTVNKEKDSVRFLGILISKPSYNALMIGIIASLAVLLGALIFLFKRSNIITNRTKSDLAEIKEEFDTHRNSSREREEKMARRHLDEILKYKNQKQSTHFSNK